MSSPFDRFCGTNDPSISMHANPTGARRWYRSRGTVWCLECGKLAQRVSRKYRNKMIQWMQRGGLLNGIRHYAYPNYLFRCPRAPFTEAFVAGASGDAPHTLFISVEEAGTCPECRTGMMWHMERNMEPVAICDGCGGMFDAKVFGGDPREFPGRRRATFQG